MDYRLQYCYSYKRIEKGNSIFRHSHPKILFSHMILSPFINMDPPFEEKYKPLFTSKSDRIPENKDDLLMMNVKAECELPLIDLSCLTDLKYCPQREQCLKEIRQAASEWGFFQIVNHGIPQEVLDRMQDEQMKLFHQPFSRKAEENILNLSANSYRWGNPRATCLRQFSWSEAFHIPLADIARIGDTCKSLSSSMEAFATAAITLAKELAGILAEAVNVKSDYFQDNCLADTGYLRMNRYPPCPLPYEVFGLVPHTDSSFLSVLVNQDQIGGLQLSKNGKWFNVKPNPKALVINIGDLFQALSNDVYKSAEHRVLAPKQVERFSVAYFYCPKQDAVIESCIKPSIYRKFTFREFMQQKQRDIQSTGGKVGVSRFLLCE